MMADSAEIAHAFVKLLSHNLTHGKLMPYFIVGIWEYLKRDIHVVLKELKGMNLTNLILIIILPYKTLSIP